jgi:hypothetical protein
VADGTIDIVVDTDDETVTWSIGDHDSVPVGSVHTLSHDLMLGAIPTIHVHVTVVSGEEGRAIGPWCVHGC